MQEPGFLAFPAIGTETGTGIAGKAGPMRLAPTALLLVLTLAAATGSRAAGPRLRVMTYNIHFGAGPEPARMAPGARWVEEIAAMIRSGNPDVVALQEVVAGGAQSRFVNQRKLLAERTGYRIFYKEAQHIWGISSGIALLTRHPVLEERLVEIMRPGELPIPGQTRKDHAERRVAQAARIRVPGFQPVWFVNTHFHSGDRHNRRPNFDALQNRLVGTLSGPVVMLGDFNSRAPKPDGQGRETAYGRSIMRTADQVPFEDALEARGKFDPRTFRSASGHFRLDWIFVSTRHFLVQNAYVTGWELSDHEAIVATLVTHPPAAAGASTVERAPIGAGPLGLLGVGGLR